jgi:hypothetical protein
LLSEIPFPLFNDVILKQIEENKKQQAKLENLKRQGKPGNKRR